VNATTATTETQATVPGKNGKGYQYKTVSNYLTQSPQPLKNLYEDLKAFLMSLGDDVQLKTLKFYFAFKRIKNFACVEVHPGGNKLSVLVKVEPGPDNLEKGFTRSVKDIGHLGTGDLEITIASHDDLERAKPLLLKSYENS
jgi:predicted transport protein